MNKKIIFDCYFKKIGVIELNDIISKTTISTTYTNISHDVWEDVRKNIPNNMINIIYSQMLTFLQNEIKEFTLFNL
jgi:hypothetical protein